MALRILTGTRPQDIPIEDRTGRAGRRLASGAALGHCPLSSSRRIADPVPGALGLGALQGLHCRRRDGSAGAGGVDRRAAHSKGETTRRPSSRCVEVRSALRKSYERVRDLGSRLLNAQESERSRIARELHDDISQQLAVLKIDLQRLRRTVQGHAEALAAEAVKRVRGHRHECARSLAPPPSGQAAAAGSGGGSRRASTRDGPARRDHHVHARERSADAPARLDVVSVPNRSGSAAERSASTAERATCRWICAACPRESP